jgi:hypothetical protein
MTVLLIAATGFASAFGAVDLSVSSLTYNPQTGVISPVVSHSVSADQATYQYGVRVTLDRNGNVTVLAESTSTGEQQINCPNSPNPCTGSCKVYIIGKGTTWGNCDKTPCQCYINDPCPVTPGFSLLSGDIINVAVTPGSGVTDPDLTNNTFMIVLQ